MCLSFYPWIHVSKSEGCICPPGLIPAYFARVPFNQGQAPGVCPCLVVLLIGMEPSLLEGVQVHRNDGEQLQWNYQCAKLQQCAFRLKSRYQKIWRETAQCINYVITSWNLLSRELSGRSLKCIINQSDHILSNLSPVLIRWESKDILGFLTSALWYNRIVCKWGFPFKHNIVHNSKSM